MANALKSRFAYQGRSMRHLKTTPRAEPGRTTPSSASQPFIGTGFSRWGPLAIGIDGSPEELRGERQRSKTGATSLAIRSFPHPTGP